MVVARGPPGADLLARDVALDSSVTAHCGFAFAVYSRLMAQSHDGHAFTLEQIVMAMACSFRPPDFQGLDAAVAFLLGEYGVIVLPECPKFIPPFQKDEASDPEQQRRRRFEQAHRLHHGSGGDAGGITGGNIGGTGSGSGRWHSGGSSGGRGGRGGTSAAVPK